MGLLFTVVLGLLLVVAFFLLGSVGSRCEGSCSSSCGSQALEHGFKNLHALCLAPGFPKHSCKVLSFVVKILLSMKN